MATVARVKKDGSLSLKDNLDERLPTVTNGLVTYYPLDSKTGAIDIIGGIGTNQNLESGVNYLDAMNNGGWRNPANWGIPCTWDDNKQALKFNGAQYGWMNAPIIIDTSKHYEIQMSVYVESHSGTGDVNLYLGGYGWDANGTGVTTNNMYFLCCGHDYPSLTGVWTTFRTTLSGTGALPYLNNYSFPAYPSENGGWSENGRTTKYYRYGGLFNYSSGSPAGVMYIKDCVVRTVDPDTSNCITAGDGISVSPSYINLHPNPFLTSDTSGWGEYDNVNKVSEIQRVAIYDHPDPRCKFAYHGLITGAAAANGTGFNPSGGSHAANTTYIKFAWVKTNIGGVVVNCNYSNIGYSGGSGDVTLEANKWTRVWAFHNNTIVQSDSLHVGFYHPNGYNFRFWATGFMWANVSEAKDPVLGTKLQSRLFLPVQHVLNNTTCSINFDYYKVYGISNTIISASTTLNTPPNSLWWGLYHDASGGTYTHWLDGTGSTALYTHAANTWCNYTICWDASKEYIYANGALVGQKAKSANLATNQLPVITLGWGWTGGDGRFKNFKIYNKCLSTSEITNLAKEVSKINSVGDIISPLYIESSTLPSNSFYYPLASDTKDVSRTFDAATSTNVAYDDGGIWVGTAVTNEATAWNPTAQRPYCTYLGLKNGVDCWKFTSGAWTSTWSGNSYGYMAAANFTQPAGTPFTFSYKAYLSNDCTSKDWWDVEGGAGGGSGDYLDGTYRPKIIQRSFSSTFSSTSNIVPYVYPQAWGTTTSVFPGYHMIWRPQVELKSFRSPVATMSRGATHLSYNFNSSIGLDWSSNWTISYWKKPVATYSDNFVGYNIESIGANAGQGATYYGYWGKPNASDVYHTYPTTTTLAFGSYYNNWQFVCIRKSGGTIYYNFIGKDVIFSSSTTTVPTTATACVTNFGYDFKMGGWDNANPCNTYYRDLVVVKAALSDAEMNLLYRQMKLTKDNSITRSLIEEGL